ncbi:MAG: hypothetical protein Q7T46_06580 [Polaromonas sp.]|nr:hypothetical protein [Polaromonas sp.]
MVGSSFKIFPIVGNAAIGIADAKQRDAITVFSSKATRRPPKTLAASAANNISRAANTQNTLNTVMTCPKQLSEKCRRAHCLPHSGHLQNSSND